MNKNTLCKKIHQTMRANGYERKSHVYVGKKIYKTIVLPTSVVVKIPGNWSMRVNEEIKMELLQVLNDFNPSLSCYGHSGVEIYFS